MPPLCRETQSLGQQMLELSNGGLKWVNSRRGERGGGRGGEVTVSIIPSQQRKHTPLVLAPFKCTGMDRSLSYEFVRMFVSPTPRSSIWPGISADVCCLLSEATRVRIEGIRGLGMFGRYSSFVCGRLFIYWLFQDETPVFCYQPSERLVPLGGIMGEPI